MMIKYVDAKVTLQELPNEITLCINITGCPNRCPGCHSEYLQEDIGIELTPKVLDTLIDNNKGISAICFMGGDSDPLYIAAMAKYIKENTDLLVGWYSGKQEINKDVLMNLEYFNFIKVGPYIEELGPLNNPNTNQKMYEVEMSKEVDEAGNPVYGLVDITYKFFK